MTARPLALAIPLVLLSLLSALVAAPSAEAQLRWSWPEKSKNLKVLPKNTPPEKLRAVMTGFTRSLGPSIAAWIHVQRLHRVPKYENITACDTCSNTFILGCWLMSRLGQPISSPTTPESLNCSWNTGPTFGCRTRAPSTVSWWVGESCCYTRSSRNRSEHPIESCGWLESE